MEVWSRIYTFYYNFKIRFVEVTMCCKFFFLRNIQLSYDVLGSIYVVAATKNPKIILDNNVFTICIKSADKTRWRCTAYFKSKCRASLLTYGKYVNARFGHNHPPTVKNPEKLENAMRQNVLILRSD